MGALVGYLSPEKIDSEGQLKAARERTFTREQEDRAKSAGYKNANEMLLFLEAQQRKKGGVARAKVDLKGGMDWHPRNLLNRASAAISSALERD